MSWKAKILPRYLLYENKLNLIFFQSLGLKCYKSVQFQNILFEFNGMLFISRSAQIHNNMDILTKSKHKNRCQYGRL